MGSVVRVGEVGGGFEVNEGDEEVLLLLLEEEEEELKKPMLRVRLRVYERIWGT